MGKEIKLCHRGKTGECPINEFDLNSMVENPAIIMVAKRGSGKSWVVRAVLNHFSKTVPFGIIICPTDKMNGFYSSFVPDSYIYYEFKTEVIEKVLGRQQDIIEKGKIRKAMGKKTNPKMFIVMDDCLSSKGEWAKDPKIHELLFNGRHYQIMYILTMQFPLGIKPELRTNFDYIFLLADDNINNLKRLYDHYAGVFPNFEAFRQVFSQLTSDFGSMVIVNRECKSNLFEKIYYYKAPDLSKNTEYIGGNQYIKFHNDNYNENWNKHTRTSFDMDYAMSKKTLQHKKLNVLKLKNE